MTPLEVLATSVSTTAAMLLVVLAGAVMVQRMTDRGAQSLRGILYVNVSVALPCLFFTKLAVNLDAGRLADTWPIVFVGLGHITVGLLLAKLSRVLGLLSADYEPLMTLAMCSGNSVAVPLGLIAAIHGVAWWDGSGAPGVGMTEATANAKASYAYAETLVFTFNVFPAVALWAVGNRTIELAAERADNGGAAVVNDSLLGAAQSPSCWTKLERTWRKVIKPAISVPLRAALLGCFVGLTPTLHWLASEAPVTSAITAGLASAGTINVPLTMLVLGASMYIQRSERLARERAASEGPAASLPPPTPTAAATADDDERDETMLVPIEQNPSFSLPPLSDAAKLDTTEAALDDDAREALRREFEAAIIAGNGSFAIAPPPRAPHPSPVAGPAPAAIARGQLATPSMRPALGSVAQGPASHAAAPTSPLALPRPAPSPPAAPVTAASPSEPPRSGGTWEGQGRFVALVMGVRYVLLPAVTIASLWACGLLPSEPFAPPREAGGFAVDRVRVLALVAVFQAFAPPAASGGIICTLHGYMPEQHGLMLATAYGAFVLPCVAWVFAALWLLA